MESFLFLDDNPTEINWVKSQLPMVECHLLPQNFTKYPQYLDSINSLILFYDQIFYLKSIIINIILFDDTGSNNLFEIIFSYSYLFI